MTDPRAGLLLGLLALARQDPGLPVHADDALHLSVRLEVGAEGALVEHVAGFDGTLHVWASSDEIDPALQVERLAGAGGLLEDEDAGGGTTAWLEVEVRPGETLSARVSPRSGTPGGAELHLVAAPETEATRAAAGAAWAELDAIAGLREEGALAEARRRVAALGERLRSAEGAATSERVGTALWEVGHVAYELSSLEVASLAWEAAHDHRERSLPAEHADLLRAKGNLAVTLRLLGELARAHQLEERVHSAWERLRPGDHLELLSAKQNLAVTRLALGDLEGALELHEELHAARERSLPPGHPDLLWAKASLAETRRALGDLEGALELEEHVLAARERLLSSDHPDLLIAEWNLAATLLMLGDLDGALQLNEHVHAVRERSLPAGHRDLLAAKLNLAATRAAIGDLEGALVLEQEVHAAWERQLPADHPDLLLAKENLAATSWSLGDLEVAHALERQVHAARERLLPAEHPLLLRARQSLAIMRRELGDVEGALQLEEHVLVVRQRLLAVDHPDLLAIKLNLANTRRELGDLAGALALEEEVHAAWERLLPADHPDLLRARANVALTRLLLGDLEGALALAERVQAGWEQRALPDDHPDVLKALHLLAAIRGELGDLAGALELEEHVLAARQRVLPADNSHVLRAQLHLAGTRRALGDLDGALELEEHVHSVREQSLPADHAGLLAAKENLAVTRAELGDLEGALELQVTVHAERTGSLPADHPGRLAAELNLATTRVALGDRKGARALVRSLLEGQLALANGLRAASPRVARSVAGRELRRLSNVLSLARAVEVEPAAGEQDFLPELFAVLESLRCASTASGAVSRAAARFPELAGLRAELAAVSGALSGLSLAAPREEPEDEDRRRRILELSERRDGLEVELLAGLAERGHAFERPSLRRVARGLAQGSALVSFLRYTRSFERDPATGERPPPVDSLLAFVVWPEARIERVELGPAAPLEERLAAWRRSLGRPVVARGLGRVSAGSVEDAGDGEGLRRLVLDPVLARLSGVRTLHLVLDDFLHLMPVEALPYRGATLGEAFEVRHEPTVLRLLRDPEPAAGEARLLAIGGVDYDAEVDAAAVPVLAAATPPVRARGGDGATRAATLAEGFGALDESAGEVAFVCRANRARFGGDPVLLTGAEATKRALFEEAPRTRWLHLATHGWFAPETVTSTIDAAERRGEAPSRAERTVQGFAPQTLCGLALAGANRGMDEVGKVPGILTAEELATLDLSSCELAVLSACETNVGLRRAGQGIQSLQTALHAAGARTAITSLWKVDDAATRRLFEVFYTKLWDEGLGKADALWQAKVALRAEGRPTRDWAGWVLTGDPD